MSIAMNNDPRIVSLAIDDETISATLADGRTISVPLAWSWGASDEHRQVFEIIGNGQGIHWPDVDISAQGMLAGIPARPPKQTA
jgi:hypothetical protein